MQREITRNLTISARLLRLAKPLHFRRHQHPRLLRRADRPQVPRHPRRQPGQGRHPGQPGRGPGRIRHLRCPRPPLRTRHSSPSTRQPAAQGTIGHLLTWKPQYAGTTDTWGNYVANGNYNSFQVALAERAAKGLTFNVNYTYSQNVDDAGTQRSGYAIPGNVIANGVTYAKNRIDRSISINDQPQNLSIYGVYTSQYNKGSFGGEHFITRALLSGWQTSMIFQYSSGLPLPIVATCSSLQNVGQGQPACRT